MNGTLRPLTLCRSLELRVSLSLALRGGDKSASEEPVEEAHLDRFARKSLLSLAETVRLARFPCAVNKRYASAEALDNSK